MIALFVWLLPATSAEAALKCSRLIKTVGGEQLINTCGSCRIVKIQRKRPSSAAPINRTLTVPPKTTTDLSFRGPGQSRILSDTPCRPSAAGSAPTGASKSTKSDGKRCIVLQRTDKAGVTGLALANTCNECRMAVVDRIDGEGARKSQSIAIGGRSLMPIPALGALQAAILDDQPCK
ncbi:MAG: hypothetical protein HQ513_16530 [Rhodospirillales bacterium]|nr:hypothetical protein [Rhodospirillales bacterium]